MVLEKVQLSDLNQRLNQVLPKIESAEFLNNLGLGNEIGFYVFDYPAEAELTVRDHLEFMTNKLQSRGKTFANINLFAEVTSLLESRNLLTRSFQKQKLQGDAALFNALKGPLEQNRFAEFIVNKIDLDNCDFILMHGLGSAWPIIRGHELLNALHAKVGAVPTLLFYPGEWDGLALKAFNRMESNNYYRAFKLVP
jgi:hypothetical protein